VVDKGRKICYNRCIRTGKNPSFALIKDKNKKIWKTDLWIHKSILIPTSRLKNTKKMREKEQRRKIFKIQTEENF
jgi:hypothetical protein